MKQGQTEILELAQSACMTAEAHGFEATAAALREFVVELAHESGLKQTVPNAAELDLSVVT